MPAYANELVRPCIVRKKDVIFNLDVTSQGRAVGEDVVIANYAIVGDVHSHHQKVSRAKAFNSTFATAAMQRAKLANQIVIADDEAARFAFELDILGLATDHRVLEDPVALSDACIPLDHCVCANLAA